MDRDIETPMGAVERSSSKTGRDSPAGFRDAVSIEVELRDGWRPSWAERSKGREKPGTAEEPTRLPAELPMPFVSDNI